MIASLTVKNIALVEEVTIDFEEGFNVLSGETGAGKSIIIGALGFLFGGKSSADLVRKGCDEGLVSATFIIRKNEPLKNWLSERGIELEDDTVLARRNIKASGRNYAWLNSNPVTRAELEEFTSFLVDIHGQHDHQSLFRVSEHRRFLDAFAEIENEVEEYSQIYNSLMNERKKLEALEVSQSKQQERQDYLNFAVDEIIKAKLKPTEDVELEAEAKKLDGYEKLFENLQEVVSCTTRENAALSQLKKAMNALKTAADIDKNLTPILDRITNQYYELEDACRDVQHNFERLSFDENRRDEIQERLSLIYKLKKKYGDSIEAILQYAKNAEDELADLQNSEENKANLEKRLKELQAELVKLGLSISKKRQAASTDLEKRIESVLKNLGMQKTQFKVSVSKKELEGTKQKAGPFGFDDIEFLISPNLGESLKPLAKIASGGEISRVMLALKTVLADSDDVDSLIFDEIDVGIGGEVALSVAEHIKELSRVKQILCVTHLAVIAAHAGNHIKIEKTTEGGRTFTYAKKISGEKRQEEIARMLSGDEESKASMLHAKDLLEKYSG
ncbi:MAG: DNA repair protein RecN [Treponemataceae bacterium]